MKKAKEGIKGFVISEIISVIAVLAITILVCLLTDRTTYLQTWIAAVIFGGSTIFVIGAWFGTGSFGIPDPQQAYEKTIGVVGAIGIGVATFVTFALFIFFVCCAFFVCFAGILVAFKAVSGIVLYATATDVFPATFAAGLATISIYELIVPMPSFTTKVIFLATGFVNFGILYGLPKLI